MSSFWLILKQQWTIKISSPLFSIFSLVAILVGSRDQRTHFVKGATQGPFHQSLVAIGPVVSEEKIKMWNVDGRTTDDGQRTKSDDNSSHGLKARWAKKGNKMNCELMLTYDTLALRQTESMNLTGQKTLPTIWGTYMKLVTKYQISAINSCWEKCDEKWAYMFNVYKNQQSRQTGSRNLKGPKTLPTIYEACDQISDLCHQ